MKNAVILHGTNGSPEGNWFRWLEAELRAKGIEVWLPQLPRPELPSLRDWINFVRSDCPFNIDQDTLIFGHSSGATVALLIAGESQQKPGMVAAVSPFVPIGTAYTATLWENNVRLFDIELDLEKCLRRARQDDGESNIVVVHSNDDPYIPLGVVEYIADLCGGELIIINGQGHFNLEKGPEYVAFPELMRIIDERILA